jgi:hypothetical protein
MTLAVISRTQGLKTLRLKILHQNKTDLQNCQKYQATIAIPDQSVAILVALLLHQTGLNH